MNGLLVIVAACLVSAAAGWYGGQSHTTAVYEARIAKEQATADKAVVALEREARREEERRTVVVGDAEHEATAVKKDSQKATVVAVAVAERLHDELEVSKRRFASSQASCDARIDQQRGSARAQYDLLARLYQESDTAAGELAAEAEGYRTAGVTCNKQYEGVRNGPPKP